MKIQDINEINELGMNFKVKFKVNMEWFDPRITFRNLEKSSNENLLDLDEVGQIWIPQLLILNSNEEKRQLPFIAQGNELDFSVKIGRLGKPQGNPLEEIDEDYIYPGEENPIILTNYITVMLKCKYDLTLYPFDVQKCPIQLMVLDHQYLFQFALQWQQGEINSSIRDHTLDYLPYLSISIELNKPI